MLTKLVLIVDKRKELPAKYKKYIEASGVSVMVASNIEKSLDILTEYEPDLVLISDSLDSSLVDSVRKLRMISYSNRPCIIALSKSSELQDKLDVLGMGADDFLSEPIDSEEFKARINAHLRRHYESMISDVTQLPYVKFSLKVLKRTLVENNKWAGMLVKINNLEQYSEIYGELASDKMRQTYTAIINSTLDNSDFLGELAKGEFLILTNPVKAERVASFLVYAFDSIVEKFYNEEDANSGYIILHGDDDAGKRVELVSTSIGVVTGELQLYSSINAVISALFSTCKLAKTNIKSAYAVERAKLSAKNAVFDKEYNNRVLVVEIDEALNFLLKTTAQMQGYDVVSVNDYDNALRLIKSFNPAVIILDAGDIDSMLGLDLCKKLKQDNNLKKIKVILSTIIHDKKMVLNTGADLYMPKPYELIGIFNWVEILIKEYNC